MGITENFKDLLLILVKNNKFLSPFYIKKAFSALFYALFGSRRASRHGPLRLQIEITDLCNFDCVMCDRHNLKKIRTLNHSISYKKFKVLVEEIKPLYLTLNGLGEPLLNKELFKFLKLCNEKRITTSIPSNMSLMNEENINKLIENLPSILTFSFHAPEPSLFNSITLSKSFQQSVDNFEKLLSLLKNTSKHIDIRILCVLQATNLEQYNAMFEYLKKWDLLDSFRLEPVFDFVPYQNVVPSKEKVAKVLQSLNEELKKTKKEEKRTFLNNWKEKLLELYERTHLKNEAPCLTPWISTYITATGKVLPCCYLTNEKYVMGNINQNSFLDIWNGTKYQNFRSSLIHSRKNIEECYRCYWNDMHRVKLYRLLMLGYSRWNSVI